jgi:antitoxin (DNA-binding transcriptional repressor) of toxin-antitoxin stability system
MVIKSMSAAAFKARCLTLMDVKETREPVVIAKRGQPVACISVGRRRSEYLGFIFPPSRPSITSSIDTASLAWFEPHFDHTQS